MPPIGGTSPRTDLPWLRRRAIATPAAPARRIDTTHPGRSSASPPAAKIDTTHPGRTSAPPADTRGADRSPSPATGSLDLSGPRIDTSHPGRTAQPASSSLDLSGPRIDTSHPGRSAPTPAADPLDLSARPSDPLDLSARAADPLDLSAGPAAPKPRPTPAPARPQPRARNGPPTLLGPDTPTVTLTRLQSGVGVLQVELVTTVPALRLGAAYELVDGRTSAIVDGGHADAAPPTRPVLQLTRDRYAGLRVDLRQTRALRRLAVLAVPQTAVDWTGTLVVTTAAGARMEAPLDLGHGEGPAVLLTAYVVDGEIVLRAERELVAGTLRDACLAYGYDRITWADDRTPAS